MSSRSDPSTGRTTARRYPVAAVLALLGAGATGVLAVGHAGVEVPVVSALGPGGDRAVWPAAGAFTVACLAFLAVGAGLRRGAVWSRVAGLGLFAVTVVTALVPYRGVGSAIGAVLGAAGVAVLARPGEGRRAA